MKKIHQWGRVMSQYFKFFGLLSIVVLACSFSKPKQPVVEPGKVVYYFESGKMQCLSEVDQQGKITILLQSLDVNTTLTFNKVEQKKNQKPVLTLFMAVKEDTDICAGWINAQEVKLAIHPKPVSQTTLNGDVLFTKGNITVLMAPKDTQEST